MRMVRSALQSTGWRFVVLDPNAEWPGAAGRLRGVQWASVRDAEGAARALDAKWRAVLCRPGPGANATALADELARACIGRGAILVVPEAYRAFPLERGLPSHVREIAHRYRHPNVRAGLWVDSQHFRDLSPELRNELVWLYVFGLSSPRDQQALRDYGGPELADAALECARRAAKGEKGWHARVHLLAPMPPYPLLRERI